MSDISQLEQDMKSEARLILKSIAWAEQSVKQLMTELDRLRLQGNNFFEEEKLETELYKAIMNLGQESKKMDSFMVKYRKIIQQVKHEKKKSIRHFGKKKQIRLRGFPAHARRQKSGN